MSIYHSPENFINRELSLIEFNQRVLEEAQDTSHPLFERLKFESIVSSNLDEFFMIRVGSLSDQIAAKFNKPDAAGLTPIEQMAKISMRVHKLVYDQLNCYNRSLKIALKKENILFLKSKELNEKQCQYIKEYYLKNIYPVLTPMVVDQSRPFPLILNRSLNIGLLLQESKDTNEYTFATIQVPSVLERIIEVPYDNGKAFVFLEDIIKMNLNSLFTSHKIVASSCYRITRNADLTLDEEGAEDLLEAIEESLKQRKWGNAVRLEFESGIDERLLNILEEELEISKDQEYEINGPIDLTFLMKLIKKIGYKNLEYTPMKPQLPYEFLKAKNIFEAISQKDILLHHPYESFDPIIDLVKQAAVDPNVLAIKQTLYRVSGNSPIIKALIKAAEQGKQVTVLVELKARFDEENNILWAKRLEESGCHVIYGLIGLKTHCKILLVVRREQTGIKRYVHLGTGNYNDVTAKLYTDLGLLTTNPYLGSDASAIFNMLSGHSHPTDLYKLSLAPLNLRERFLYMISQETKNANMGKAAKIVAKMNSLVDTEIIEALYKASSAGVNIDLIVRGVCCLRPGIPGISENISVRSIVGRLLEHSRIYYFYNDGNETIYLSSADWMNRNLDRRVELLFPVEDKAALFKIKEILDISLSDTVKTRILNTDGTYTRINRRGKENIDSQKIFYNIAMKNNYEEQAQLQYNKEYWIENGFKPRLAHSIE
ncbi:RNA degradosome polyphosphate kinase [Clostridium magnum]|uniref:Polyphosphate kinase n=1 Tax=Clostridium magnum DSM 2767 TaxID=1121326 RepID=A0A161WU21_9CLOT|nr:RNA degradosome polyphosphate kinase [Clostridium magnum]KZL90348.1 polyphosphate kinase [Clostridium magnum DSM 2767]SHH82727.1 polyphosphate kinase [Clostridium magnum DSM 2767]